MLSTRLFLRSGFNAVNAVIAVSLASAVLRAAEPPQQKPPLPPIYSYRAADIDTLRKGFRSPPREAGPWVYWMFFENVMAKEEITLELEEMAAAGIAGAEMRFLSMHGFATQPGPWFHPEGWSRLGQKRLEFLSPEFVEMLEHACAEAKRLDLRLALTLGMGWPPGGPWITDAYRSKHLVARSTVVQGPKPLRGDEARAVPAGAMVFAWQLRDGRPDAQDVVVESFRDLSDGVNPQRQLEWDVPEGRWLIATFHYAPGGLCDKGNGPEVDPGSREAVLFHLNHLFGKLQPRLGAYFGSTLVEIASDS
ncbi:MAG: glycosyl hydrolase, partial [Pirellulales bacterium]